MFQGIKNGWDLIKESIRVFNHHPRFLVPLFITWLIYAPIILYLKYLFNWNAYTGIQILWILFGIIFIFAFLLSFSCSMLLELIQQLETGQRMSLTKALGYTLGQNILKIIPLVFVWAIIWFILTIIQVLLSKKKRESEKEPFTAENAARTLAGFQRFSLSRAFFKALEKGVRMIMFLILPAIAWENLGFWKSVKKGLAVFQAHLSEFVTGFILTGVAAMFIFLPPAILFLISDKLEVSFPDSVWVATIIYIAFAWSYSIYLEQMFTAELYLWHLRWEKEVTKAQREIRPIPSMREVQRPSVLDEVHELIDKAEVIV
ncbi:MAG: Uncharacterized protein LiPW31_188 [Microgenomates group bacterium LiPW_31]|nr:MAG: Uncharacterized protein LiPW31_188 [Microgenomates group bacterium LiPW_31]